MSGRYVQFYDSEEFPREDGCETRMYIVKWEWPHKNKPAHSKDVGASGWLASRAFATKLYWQKVKQGYFCMGYVGYFATMSVR